MTSVPPVVTDPIAVRSELFDMDRLEPEVFLRALEGGVLSRATCTDNDPPYFPGATFHGVTTRSLRDQLLPAGWTKNDAGGYSRTIAPSAEIAVVVATGDERTGKYDSLFPDRQPKTTRAKGPLTKAVIEQNEQQLELGVFAIRPSKRPTQTWVFLIHYAGAGRATAELSLPRSLDAESRIAAWRRRIVIVAPDEGGLDPIRRRGPETGPDFDVEVLRRASLR